MKCIQPPQLRTDFVIIPNQVQIWETIAIKIFHRDVKNRRNLSFKSQTVLFKLKISRILKIAASQFVNLTKTRVFQLFLRKDRRKFSLCI